jgi:hypothetical protein
MLSNVPVLSIAVHEAEQVSEFMSGDTRLEYVPQFPLSSLGSGIVDMANAPG